MFGHKQQNPYELIPVEEEQSLRSMSEAELRLALLRSRQSRTTLPSVARPRRQSVAGQGAVLGEVGHHNFSTGQLLHELGLD